MIQLDKLGKQYPSSSAWPVRNAYGLTILEDTKGAFPPYDAVLLLSDNAIERGFGEELQPLVGSISYEAGRFGWRVGSKCRSNSC